MGFILWGMVLDPTCFSGSKLSPNSLISVRCRLRISRAILSRVLARFARSRMYSAWLSLCTTWLDILTAGSPSISETLRWTFSPSSPSAAVVPTAPVIIPTQSLPLQASSRSYWRWSSSAQIANFIPYVVGSACCPWVLPIQTVFLFSSASFRMIFARRATFSCMMSMESRSKSDCELSMMSLEVAPKCTYSPASLSQTSAKAFTMDAIS